MCATITAPPLRGMRYTFRNWHMDEISAGRIGDDGVLVIPVDQPVFIVELRR